ncbi:amino acid permease [Streptomyces sp. NPDC002491]
MASRSVHVGAKVLAALLIAETAVLALLAGAILLEGGANGLSLASFAPSHVLTSQMSASLGLAVAAFIGFEATALYREEARDPDRTVPRATYLAVGFLGLFYTFVVWVIVQAFGDAGAVGAAAQTRPRCSSPP